MSRWRLLALLLIPISLPAAESEEAQRAKDERIVQTVLRLPGFDLSSKPEAKAAVLRHLQRIEGEEKYLDLVGKLKLAADVEPALLRRAIAAPESNVAVNGMALLLKAGRLGGIRAAVADKDDVAAAMITALGLTGERTAEPLIEAALNDAERSLAVRSAAVRALSRLPGGEQKLLEQVQAAKLAEDLKFSAANVLLTSTNTAIKAEAGKHLSLPATADAKPLPTITELVKVSGDTAAGQALFASQKAQCSKCHVVNGQGKEVGPNLSEIGSKLSKDALYLSILDPSAGVSFNYETSQIVTTDGQVLQGIITSETAEAVTLKTAEAISRVIPKADIDETTRLKVSLMPQDLQRQLTAQNLVDIVEYLTTLKKK